MRLLNQGRGTGGYGKEMVGEGSELTAPFPGEGNGRHLHRTCLFKGCNDIRRSSRSADSDQNGAGLSISLHLAGEDRFEAVVVSASGEDSSIGRKANDIEGLTIEQEAADQFRAEVHGIRRRAAVAADQDGLAGAERGGEGSETGGHKLFAPGAAREFEDFDGFGKVVGKAHGIDRASIMPLREQ